MLKQADHFFRQLRTQRGRRGGGLDVNIQNQHIGEVTHHALNIIHQRLAPERRYIETETTVAGLRPERRRKQPHHQGRQGNPAFPCHLFQGLALGGTQPGMESVAMRLLRRVFKQWQGGCRGNVRQALTPPGTVAIAGGLECRVDTDLIVPIKEGWRIRQRVIGLLVKPGQVFHQRAETGWIDGDHVGIDMQAKPIVRQQAH